jgi:D-alanyl-D-alanine carboxypeptidase
MKETSKELFNKYEIRFLASLAGILFVLLALSIALESRIEKKRAPEPHVISARPFSADIQAKAAYVYDIRTGTVLYEKNSEARLPLASLTKVMTALVATEVTPKDSIVEIDRDALLAEGDSGLEVGERWSLKNLLDFSLTSSSNDGMKAVALALGGLDSLNASSDDKENAFVRLMNKKADELGLKNTYYFNETGLDESDTKGGAYGSAQDMASLFSYIVRTQPKLLSATREEEISLESTTSVHVARNTDEIVSDIPGLKASKTGFTSIAGGNLVVVFDPEIGRPVAISVLGSTADGRFEDMKILVDKAIEAIK